VRAAAAEGNEEAVRELLLGVTVELPRSAMDRLVPLIVELLSDPRADIRDVAAYALERIGLPEATPAIPRLREISEHDCDDYVRSSARDALARLGVSGEKSLK
jgi:HEAT repeat protein